VIADWRALPFRDDSFGCIFADPPWAMDNMKACGDFCKHALYISPVLYLMAPWYWVSDRAERTAVWIRELPGINVPVLLVRYERTDRDQLSLFG
jgi:hypothetical protein